MGNLCDCCGPRHKERKPLPENAVGGSGNYGFGLAKNDRLRMEDAVAVRHDVAGYQCFLVLDGHGGDQAATIAADELPDQLDRHLRGTTDMAQAMHAAFAAADEKLNAELTRSGKKTENGEELLTSGTVACLALLKGNEMILANLGDCRAMVCNLGPQLRDFELA